LSITLTRNDWNSVTMAGFRRRWSQVEWRGWRVPMTRVVLGAVAALAASLSSPAGAADLNYHSRGPYTVNPPLSGRSWAGPAFGEPRADAFGLSESHSNGGCTAGVGAEFAFAPNWSAKVEYLSVDLANSTFVITGAPHGLTFGTVRAGVNYHF